jgi:L-alanine-DL-glutamate epimerase-like enolase superfamily enzyme
LVQLQLRLDLSPFKSHAMLKLMIWEKKIVLKDVFTVSREAYSYKNCLIVGLQHENLVGYGEATEFQVYGSDILKMKNDLEMVARQLTTCRFKDPVDLWHTCYPLLHENPFAQCALDVAAHDLWGKMYNKNTAELLGIRTDNYPKSSISISMDTLERQIDKVKYYKDWPYMKIKVSGEQDVEKIKKFRNYTDAIFRVDANCGWTVEETIRFSKVLSGLGVDLIEQPLGADDYESMEMIKQRSAVPLIADESFRGTDCIEKCLKGFHAVNLKLMKVGGITPALDILQKCREKGFKIMIGCMPESSIGISAISVLAPLVDYVDMDSIELIASDFAHGIRLSRGEIINTRLPGLGFTVNAEFQCI